MSKTSYLNAIGITQWKLRPENSESAEATDSWIELQKKVSQCTACRLHKTRTQTVFGIGNRHADLFIVGEAPGQQEDSQGEPFVGRAGQLLNAMLASIALSRNDVYITNVVKSRPPNNRDPAADEIRHCLPFLHQQIALIQPKLIVTLGRIAAHSLLNTTASLEKLRGKIFHYGAGSTPLIVTYHPAYLLRYPKDKRKAQEDLLFIRKHL